MVAQPADDGVEHDVVAREVVGQSGAALSPPSVAQPLSSSEPELPPEHVKKIEIKEGFQACVAVCFVLGLVFLSFHAVHYAGY